MWPSVVQKQLSLCPWNRGKDYTWWGRRDWRGDIGLLGGERPAGIGLFCPSFQKINHTFLLEGNPVPTCFNTASPLPARTVSHLSTFHFSALPALVASPQDLREVGCFIFRLLRPVAPTPPFPCHLLCCLMSRFCVSAFHTWLHTLYLMMQIWEVVGVYGILFEIY